MAEERKFYAGYLFSESKWNYYIEERNGTSVIELDSIQRCSTYYYTRAKRKKMIFHQLIADVEYVTQVDSSQTGRMFYGKSADGTYFIEKLFHNRPTGEGIVIYQIPEDYYKEVIQRFLNKSYLPLELFRDSLYRLMNYKLTGVFWDKYEEGCDGMAFVHFEPSKWCIAHYFNGEMMSTPIYRHQIKEVEHVTRSDSSQTDCKYSSKTGRMDYGKASDGTYFVEKLFYEGQNELPQGILLWKIPEEYYEEVLMRLVLMPNLPEELLSDCFCVRKIYGIH